MVQQRWSFKTPFWSGCGYVNWLLRRIGEGKWKTKCKGKCRCFEVSWWTKTTNTVYKYEKALIVVPFTCFWNQYFPRICTFKNNVAAKMTFPGAAVVSCDAAFSQTKTQSGTFHQWYFFKCLCWIKTFLSRNNVEVGIFSQCYCGNETYNRKTRDGINTHVYV